jgi:hypothetical protein
MGVKGNFGVQEMNVGGRVFLIIAQRRRDAEKW